MSGFARRAARAAYSLLLRIGLPLYLLRVPLRSQWGVVVRACSAARYIP